MVPLKDRPELAELLRQAIARFEAMTPEQQEEHRRAQRESWVRGEMGLGLDDKQLPIHEGNDLTDKIGRLDEYSPGWRNLKHPNGKPLFSQDGTMLNDKGKRSIFDDVDE